MLFQFKQVPKSHVSCVTARWGGVEWSGTGALDHEHDEVMVPRLEQIELVPGEEEAASHALIGKKNKSIWISLLLVSQGPYITQFSSHLLTTTAQPHLPAIERSCFTSELQLPSEFLSHIRMPSFKVHSKFLLIFSNQKSRIHWCDCKGK